MDFNKIQGIDVASEFGHALLIKLWEKFVEELKFYNDMLIFGGHRTTAYIKYHKSDDNQTIIVDELILGQMTNDLVNDIFKKMSAFFPMLEFRKMVMCRLFETKSFTDIDNLPKESENFVIEECAITDINGFPKTSNLFLIACDDLQKVTLPQDPTGIVIASCHNIDFDNNDILPNTIDFALSRCMGCKQIPQFPEDTELRLDHQYFPKATDNQIFKKIFVDDSYNQDLKGCPKTKELHISEKDTSRGNACIYTSFDGMPDEVEDLWVDDVLEFPIEDNLPKNLKNLYLNGYFMRNKGKNYDPMKYKWPYGLQAIYFGHNSSGKYKKMMEIKFKNRNVKIDYIKNG